MKNLNKALVSICVLTLSAAVSTSAAPRSKSSRSSRMAAESSYAQEDTTTERRFHLEPRVSYAFVNPTQLNSFLADGADRFGIKSKYKISGNINFSVQAEYEWFEGLSNGLRLDYFSSSTVTATAKQGNQSANIQSNMMAVPVYFTTSYRYRFMNDWAISPSFGIGVPVAFQYSTEITGSDIPNLRNGEPTYSAHPFTWFAGLRGEYSISPAIALQAGVEYRGLASSQVTLDEKYGDVKAGRVLENKDAENVKLDMKSFMTSVGVSVAL